jgi:hypothetical protein
MVLAETPGSPLQFEKDSFEIWNAASQQVLFIG